MASSSVAPRHGHEKEKPGRNSLLSRPGWRKGTGRSFSSAALLFGGHVRRAAAIRLARVAALGEQERVRALVARLVRRFGEDLVLREALVDLDVDDLLTARDIRRV